MDPVPPSGRCRCGAPLWYVRPRDVGEEGHFACRRCGAQYRAETRWDPSWDREYERLDDTQPAS